jgi:hypothetical protein
MGKNIVLLSDGTGNSAADLHKTNVWRVYRALSTDNQLYEYDDGVGTSSFRPLALLSGAVGLGLARNVRHLYAFLSRNYNSADQDKVFAFGFSRGAYTIRMLIGLVRNQGLVDSGLSEESFQREILRRWTAYRKQRFRRLGRAVVPQTLLEDVRERGRVPNFEFVGLWDTVGAYGLPVEELQHIIDFYVYPFSFRDRRLSGIVKCAYHALSLDDERRTFHPILWDERRAEDRERIWQVWFPGAHANIGGGYPKDGLSHVSLDWMVRKASQLGLKFLEDHLREIRNQADAHDDLYNSRVGFGAYYRYSPRPVSRLCDDESNDLKIDRPKVHESVFERIRGGHVAYGPVGVPLVYDLVSRDGEIIPGPVATREIENTDVKTAPDEGDCERADGLVLVLSDTGRTVAYEALPADSTADTLNTERIEHVDLSHGSPYLEDADQARARATRMEAVWNVIWWRRIVYYLSVSVSLYLVVLPWTEKYLSTNGSLPDQTAWLSRYLGPILQAAAYLVPDWIGKMWFPPFAGEPVLFLVGGACLAITVLVGSSLEDTIRARAGDIWHAQASWGNDVPAWARDPKSTWLYQLRSDPNVVRIYRYIGLHVLPTMVLALVAIALVALARRYPDYVQVYGVLLLLAISLVIWISRGRYKKSSHQ